MARILSYASAYTATNTDITVYYPSGTVVGDCVCTLITINGEGATYQLPAGWVWVKAPTSVGGVTLAVAGAIVTSLTAPTIISNNKGSKAFCTYLTITLRDDNNTPAFPAASLTNVLSSYSGINDVVANSTADLVITNLNEPQGATKEDYILYFYGSVTPTLNLGEQYNRVLYNTPTYFSAGTFEQSSTGGVKGVGFFQIRCNTDANNVAPQVTPTSITIQSYTDATATLGYLVLHLKGYRKLFSEVSTSSSATGRLRTFDPAASIESIGIAKATIKAIGHAMQDQVPLVEPVGSIYVRMNNTFTFTAYETKSEPFDCDNTNPTGLLVDTTASYFLSGKTVEVGDVGIYFIEMYDSEAIYLEPLMTAPSGVPRQYASDVRGTGSTNYHRVLIFEVTQECLDYEYELSWYNNRNADSIITGNRFRGYVQYVRPATLNGVASDFDALFYSAFLITDLYYALPAGTIDKACIVCKTMPPLSYSSTPYNLVPTYDTPYGQLTKGDTWTAIPAAGQYVGAAFSYNEATDSVTYDGDFLPDSGSSPAGVVFAIAENPPLYSYINCTATVGPLELSLIAPDASMEASIAVSVTISDDVTLGKWASVYCVATAALDSTTYLSSQIDVSASATLSNPDVFFESSAFHIMPQVEMVHTVYPKDDGFTNLFSNAAVLKNKFIFTLAATTPAPVSYGFTGVEEYRVRSTGGSGYETYHYSRADIWDESYVSGEALATSNAVYMLTDSLDLYAIRAVEGGTTITYSSLSMSPTHIAGDPIKTDDGSRHVLSADGTRLFYGPLYTVGGAAPKIYNLDVLGVFSGSALPCTNFMYCGGGATIDPLYGFTPNDPDYITVQYGGTGITTYHYDGSTQWDTVSTGMPIPGGSSSDCNPVSVNYDPDTQTHTLLTTGGVYDITYAGSGSWTSASDYIMDASPSDDSFGSPYSGTLTAFTPVLGNNAGWAIMDESGTPTLRWVTKSIGSSKLRVVQENVSLEPDSSISLGGYGKFIALTWDKRHFATVRNDGTYGNVYRITYRNVITCRVRASLHTLWFVTERFESNGETFCTAEVTGDLSLDEGLEASSQAVATVTAELDTDFYASVTNLVSTYALLNTDFAASSQGEIATTAALDTDFSAAITAAVNTYASLGSDVVFYASVNITAQITAALTNSITIESSTLASCSVNTASLTTSILVNANVNASTTCAASLSAFTRVDASVNGAANTTASLSTDILQLASSYASCTVNTPDLDTYILLAASTSASGISTSTLYAATQFTATAACTANTDTSLYTDILQEASVSASVTALASVTTNVLCESSISVSCSNEAYLTIPLEVQSSVACEVTTSASLTTVQLSASPQCVVSTQAYLLVSAQFSAATYAAAYADGYASTSIQCDSSVSGTAIAVTALDTEVLLAASPYASCYSTPYLEGGTIFGGFYPFTKVIENGDNFTATQDFMDYTIVREAVYDGDEYDKQFLTAAPRRPVKVTRRT